VKRRSLAALAATLAPGLPGLAQGRVAGAEAPDQQNWQEFRRRFMEPDGRVIDTANGRVSHSEGQGWALLFAEAAGDRPAFDRVLDWTRGTLRRRGTDALHAWRYRPGPEAAGVDDWNNATDGDLFIAWALLRAARRWDRPELREEAVAIARDVLRLLVRRAGPLTVLLPGAEGFEDAESLVVNPSYYAFPALRALAAAAPDPLWERIAEDGLRLLRGAAAFGRWRLPPDWVRLARRDGGASLPAAWPPRFSYDAVRVPLYLAWAGLDGEPPLARAAAFWTSPAHAHVPAWADLGDDSVCSSSPASRLDSGPVRSTLMATL
jgi:endoglucanase